MMAARFLRFLAERSCCAERISHEKAQKAKREWEDSNHRGLLVEKMLLAEGSKVQNAYEHSQQRRMILLPLCFLSLFVA